MARRKKTRREQEETLIDIVEVKEHAQDFFERNQKIIIGVLGGTAVIVAGFFLYKQLVQVPKEKEAAEQMFQAEAQFEQDSFERALLNPGGGYSGFLDIIDSYKGTDAANMSNYYAGISYLHLGKFEAAISYLSDFKPDGKVTPIMKFGAMGDAYSELGAYDKAIGSYKKATSANGNNFLTPYYLKKLGLLYEKEENYKSALETYTRIKDEYAKSQDGFNIDKYLERAASQLN